MIDFWVVTGEATRAYDIAGKLRTYDIRALDNAKAFSTPPPDKYRMKNSFSVGNGSVEQPPPVRTNFRHSPPPVHPCENFALPPPPTDKKRTGPRRKFWLLKPPGF